VGVVATLAGGAACCVALGVTVAAGAERWSRPLAHSPSPSPSARAA
jgi:hypothetical protein